MPTEDRERPAHLARVAHWGVEPCRPRRREPLGRRPGLTDHNPLVMLLDTTARLREPPRPTPTPGKRPLHRPGMDPPEPCQGRPPKVTAEVRRQGGQWDRRFGAEENSCERAPVGRRREPAETDRKHADPNERKAPQDVPSLTPRAFAPMGRLESHGLAQSGTIARRKWTEARDPRPMRGPPYRDWRAPRGDPSGSSCGAGSEST
jgi:hypothetical protein